MAGPATVPGEDKHAELRSKFLSESLAESQDPNPKFGYFGLGGSLCIGDNSMGIKMIKKPKEDDAGDPITNIKTNPVKRGAGPDVYFSFCPPLCGTDGNSYALDPYIDPSQIAKKGRVKMLDPDNAMRPPGAGGQLTFPGVDLNGDPKKFTTNKLGYCYVPHMDGVKDPKEVRERYKDVLPPHNMKVQPLKKGGGGCYDPGVLLGFDDSKGDRKNWPEWMADDYDYPKTLRKKEIEEHKAKLQEAPFSGMVYGNKLFSENEDTYKYDKDRDGPTHIPRDPKPDNVKVYPHEQPFKPSNPTKKGQLKGTFAWDYGEAEMYSFPKHMEDPIPEAAKRKPKVEDGPPAWKPNHQTGKIMHNPMPSVVTNMRNMRNERPSAFARPRF